MVTIGTQVNSGWGRAEWGNEPWGLNETVVTASVTGFPLSLSLGDENVTAEVNSGWGRSTWGGQVWVSPNEGALPTGIGMSATLGSV